jgi:hypothetical protein
MLGRVHTIRSASTISANERNPVLVQFECPSKHQEWYDFIQRNRMPIKEALFWFGITVFGTGLFFWVEGDKQMTVAVILTLLGLAAVAYSVYSHYSPGVPKAPLWIALLLLTWAAIAYDYYDRNSPAEIPEFDDPGTLSQNWKHSYGHTDNSCYGLIEGGAFWSQRKDYDVAIACLFDNKFIDIKDVPLYVGNKQDIVRNSMSLNVMFNLPHGTYGALQLFTVLIPKAITISNFHTLREARTVGVKIKYLGSQTTGQ